MSTLGIYQKLFSTHRFWWYSGALLSCFTGLASVLLLTLSGWFISASAIAGFGDALAFNFMLPAAQIRALAILRTLSRYAERIVTHEATFRVLADLRSWLFQQLIPLVPGRLALLRSGDILSRLTADIDTLDVVYLRILVPGLLALLSMLGVMVYLAQFSLFLSLLIVLMLGIGAIGIPGLFNFLGRESAEKMVLLANHFRLRQIDYLQGWPDLIAYNAGSDFLHGLFESSDFLINVQRQTNRLTAIASALNVLLMQLTVVLVLSVAAVLFRNGQLTGPEVASAFFCVLAVFEFITPLPAALQLLPKTQKAAQRISEVTQLQPAVLEPAVPIDIPHCLDIAFDQVDFSYAGRTQVLKQVNLTIPYGAKIAIIGASGAGKSTLLHLLLRDYDPDQGAIRLGGHALKAYRSEDLLSCFGMLSQRSQLFATTLRENLLIAKPFASQSELNDAIVAAGLEQYLQHLPDGLDTWVGESGVKVSGGEARRIALARLYLKNAPILVLDEPTEGLDSETEADVLQALANFATTKTLIMVTHRELGLQNVEVVYRINDGMLDRVG